MAVEGRGETLKGMKTGRNRPAWVDSQLLEWMDGFLSFGLVDIFVAKNVSEQQGGIGDSVESYKQPLCNYRNLTLSEEGSLDTVCIK